ncbi:hypothetical protein [Flagellimonas meishanensis]|uniref:hypothetical protein n=1 Tax=Flagellimonas meishanensis TaxID=2873264 RepID=UPI001CA7A06D|nr:hypothetical protein [[Muricauda] meishanensis]
MNRTLSKFGEFWLIAMLFGNLTVFSQGIDDLPKRPYLDDDFPCLANEERFALLDFMLGDWEITTKGLLVGDITLKKDGKGCLITEKFTAFNGHSGAGMDYFDLSSGKWKRILVVSNGTIESFEGEMKGDKFVWIGHELRANGEKVLERVEIWKEGAKVINNIFQSFDNGLTWKQTGAEVRVPK